MLARTFHAVPINLRVLVHEISKEHPTPCDASIHRHSPLELKQCQAPRLDLRCCNFLPVLCLQSLERSRALLEVHLLTRDIQELADRWQCQISMACLGHGHANETELVPEVFRTPLPELSPALAAHRGQMPWCAQASLAYLVFRRCDFDLIVLVTITIITSTCESQQDGPCCGLIFY